MNLKTIRKRLKKIDEFQKESSDAILTVTRLSEHTSAFCDSPKLTNDILIIRTVTGLNDLGKVTLDFGGDNELDGYPENFLHTKI